jgi:hypothetical protein
MITTFHNTPQKQYLIRIDGGIEIETTLEKKSNSKQVMFLCWRIPKAKATAQETFSPKKEDLFLLQFHSQLNLLK